MVCIPQNIVPISEATYGFSIYAYSTADGPEEVEADDYWAPASDRLERRDIVICWCRMQEDNQAEALRAFVCVHADQEKRKTIMKPLLDVLRADRLPRRPGRPATADRAA